MTLIRMYRYLSSHATKLLGFAQITVGVLAVSDGLFTPLQLKWFLLFNGLLIAWRGFFNSAQIAKADVANAT